MQVFDQPNHLMNEWKRSLLCKFYYDLIEEGVEIITIYTVDDISIVNILSARAAPDTPIWRMCL